MRYIYKAKTIENTKTLATYLADLLQAGDVITLEGELGTGKTTFTKYLAAGLGIGETVNSPTFTIIKQYEGRLPLYHMDVYRLEHEEEDLGFDEYFHGNGVTVVEWAQFIADFLPDNCLHIAITYDGENARSFSISTEGERYHYLLEKLSKQMKENE